MFFFVNDTATTEIYTLSLHDALPISHLRQRLGQLDAQPVQLEVVAVGVALEQGGGGAGDGGTHGYQVEDRKSTRLNSSHANISYAVFCLKKKSTSTPYSTTRKRTFLA